MAAVKAAVASAGSLWIDPEELTRLQHPGGGVEGPLRGVAAAAVDGDHAHGREEVLRLPGVHVLGLAHEGDPAGQHEGQEEGVDHRRVVGAEDGTALGQVLDAGGADPPQALEHRGQHRLGDGVELPVLTLGCWLPHHRSLPRPPLS